MSEAQAIQEDTHNGLISELQSILGTQSVITDETERQYYSQDVYGQGPTVLAVIQPDSRENLAKAVATATAAG